MINLKTLTLVGTLIIPTTSYAGGCVITADPISQNSSNLADITAAQSKYDTEWQKSIDIWNISKATTAAQYDENVEYMKEQIKVSMVALVEAEMGKLIDTYRVDPRKAYPGALQRTKATYAAAIDDEAAYYIREVSDARKRAQVFYDNALESQITREDEAEATHTQEVAPILDRHYKPQLAQFVEPCLDHYNTQLQRAADYKPSPDRVRLRN